jgi:NAD(P)H-flavin reductase
MATIRHDGRRYALPAGQSVLDCLLEHAVAVPHSCRSGVCQTCLMRALEGTPPASAQKDLPPALALQNYFLACVCHPAEYLTVALAEDVGTTVTATIRELNRLNEEIMEVSLEAHVPLEYRPGQFINLFMDQEQVRSYSIASVPAQDDHLRVHVRRLPKGRVSGWIHEQLRVGQTIALRGPAGTCFYVPGQPEQPLLLIGTGSGLAPLYGIIRDALWQGHTGPIRLFHGSRNTRGLYLTGELRDLTREYSQFDYVPCLSGPDVPPGHAAGRAHDVALAELPDLKGWRVFLCGHPEMVQQAQMRTYLAGAALTDILADAFKLSPPRP